MESKVKTYKVVYNACFGGFGLSHLAISRLKEHGFSFEDDYDFNFIPRHDLALIRVIEDLGSAASDRFSDIRIKEIHGSHYRISEYDGRESVIVPDDMEWINIEAEE
jgi:hypothetical protein